MATNQGQPEKKFFGKGETIFAEGGPGDAAYVIESGEIGIFKVIDGVEVLIATLKDSELFGEMALIDGSQRMAEARALDQTVLICLPRQTFLTKLAKVDPFFKTLMRILVANIRDIHSRYMMRPRSVRDSINVMVYHAESLRRYMEILASEAPGPEGLKRIEVIESAAKELREMFKDHVDRRHDALSEDDLKRPTEDSFKRASGDDRK